MSSGACPPEDAFMSVRLVTLDHYTAPPVNPELDAVYSNFRSAVTYKVPVLRVFGPNAQGQKTCLHIHGIFPYMYVPKPKGEVGDGYIYQLAASIDKALNISFMSADSAGKSNSNLQHVYKIVEVRGRPFYGYHSAEEKFLKIFFYNPWMVKRTADLLQSGAVMGAVLQPHYSHVPFNLQFMMDYNLQGMNFIHLSRCLFRRSPPGEAKSAGAPPSSGRIDETQLSPDMFVPETAKMSNVELEVDAVAADILNTNQDLMQSFAADASIFKSRKLTNPGLEALWEDERYRRQEMGIESEQLSPPGSPPRDRDADFESESHKFWASQFDQLVEKLKVMAPEEDNLDDTQALPEATMIDEHIGSLTLNSSSMLHSHQDSMSGSQDREKGGGSFEDTIVDELLVSQVVKDSQGSFSKIVPSEERALADLLMGLAGDSTPQEDIDDEERELADLLAHLESEKKASGVAERADSPKVQTPSQEDLPTQSWSQAQPNAPESDTEEEEEGGHLDDGSPKRSSQTFYLQDERDDLEMSRIPEDFFHMDPEFENTGEGEKPDPFQRPCVPEPARTQQQAKGGHQTFNANIEWDDDDDAGWSQLNITGVCDETTGQSQSQKPQS